MDGSARGVRRGASLGALASGVGLYSSADPVGFREAAR